MGFFDAIESIATQQIEERMGGQPATTTDGEQVTPADQAKVAGGLMQALQEHPGGIGGLVESFQQNGLSGCVQEWASGQSQTASPEQVQQGLGGTGLIESAAEKAGVSPQIAQAAIAMLLPMIMKHFAAGGEAGVQSQLGGFAQQMLARFL
ncbi:protein of unknown function [Granulicella rosea]|uniref:DUF937 domain-containing protein n=1 Tax=Granulicella rosea TaxID=474952 RepID=A0A239D189_9BACT|nr:YidB family protein [Granulicella rosea]SNS25373.1 protein of unknown function [Granulicella rosea]